MPTVQQTKTITPEQIYGLKYSVPKSWLLAAGLLKNKKKQLLRHISKVRLEWGRNSKK